MLMVSAKNMQDYHQFTRNLLTNENNMRHLNSQFMMNFTKSDTNILLDYSINPLCFKEFWWLPSDTKYKE